MSTIQRTAVTATVAALFLSQPAPGQQETQPPEATIRTTVEEVLLDVIARDGKGRFIKDLKPEEIEIYEDGKKQELSSFRLISGTEAFAGGADGEARQLDPLRQVRLVTLAFERLDQNGRRLARKAALDLVGNDQSSNVYYSVMRIDPSLKILQPFTTDRKAVQEAVKLATGGAESIVADLNLDNLRSQAEIGAAQGTDPSSIAGGPGTAAEGANIAAAEMARVVMQMVQLATDLEGQQMGSNAISALTALVKGQQSLPGRKTVLYFSSGLHLDNNVMHRFESLVGSANSANVSFYSIDARGLQSYSTAAAGARGLAQTAELSVRTMTDTSGRTQAAEMKQTDMGLDSLYADTQGNLNTLAESTGGFLIANTNDLRKPMQKVVEDIYAYYELAYRPTNKDYNGAFRKLEVKLNRSKTDVQSRSGYFAMPPELKEALFPYEVPLLRAIAGASAPSDVDFRASWFNFEPAGGMRRCAFDLEVPFEKIEIQKDEASGLYKTSVAAVAMFKDEGGRVVRKFSRLVPLQIQEEKLESLRNGTFSYNDHFVLPPGAYQMEVAVADPQGGRIGVKKTELSIPVYSGGVAVSDLTLIKRVDEAPAENPDIHNPFLFSGGKVVPTLQPIDSKIPGAMVSIYFLVYPDKSVKDAPAATIEFYAGDQRLGQLEPELPAPDERGRIPYIASVQASALPPGAYEARVTARQGATSDIAKMSFTVE